MVCRHGKQDSSNRAADIICVSPVIMHVDFFLSFVGSFGSWSSAKVASHLLGMKIPSDALDSGGGGSGSWWRLFSRCLQKSVRQFLASENLTELWTQLFFSCLSTGWQGLES